jgi:hypothetical protein
VRLNQRSESHVEVLHCNLGLIFALVAIGHIVRLVQGWDVQIGGMEIAMSVSWIALIVSAALAVWGALVLRR